MSDQVDNVTEGLRLLADIEREAHVNMVQMKSKMIAIDVALLSNDPAQLEVARTELMSVFEAGIDMKIRNHRKMQALEAKLR